ncbi:ribonucleotide-diphosphate reductase subunit beta [Sphingobium sp. C100]|jgi:ribosomal protein L11 methyltransferase|uniref:50S ribosomal protein L11 methyltransferase n=1 Tax=Sphingobium sp. C100 TaxID=1207055 RepID=UPI0003D653E3|nr:50S ribosomal protein L11 methyltransferase [Sphingobium sp. C100]ETI63947.1 ribonucleotide-diphosphate reductase subunit beta [Sphingobium sp. C100]PHQ61921.1 MAG: 50S ribosomal protein L11 methyltransferase [Sphingobium sp.]
MNDVAAPAAQSWKVTLPCTRAEAEALDGEIAAFAMMDKPPVLMTGEASPDDEERWQLDAYFEGKPSAAAIKLLKTLVPSATRIKPVVEPLPDEDWVTISQQGLDAVTAGRFHVRNLASDPEQPGHINLLIEASRAFGTGQHETTAGCLMMLDRMRRVGMRARNVADIGTGTGLLAFAALHLWPHAHAIASDIDPVAVEISADNARANHVPLGNGPGQLALVTAAGADHPALIGRAPYDLLIANILAGPLIELAPALCGLVEDGGTIILAGLLNEQADAVLAAYRAQGMRLAERSDRGSWPTLRLRKRPTIGWRRPRRLPFAARGEAPGFGSI